MQSTFPIFNSPLLTLSPLHLPPLSSALLPLPLLVFSTFFVAVKNKETDRFTRNFHAWTHHKSSVADPVEEKRLLQKAIMKRKMAGARDAISINVASKSAASGSSKLLRLPPPPPVAAPGGWRGPEGDAIPEGNDETDA